MNVFGGFQKVIESVDVFGAEATLKERADAIVAIVEVHGVGSANTTHEATDGVFVLLVKKEVEGFGGESEADERDFGFKEANICKTGS